MKRPTKPELEYIQSIVWMVGVVISGIGLGLSQSVERGLAFLALLFACLAMVKVSFISAELLENKQNNGKL